MKWSNVLHDFVGDDGAAMEIFGIGHEIIEELFMFIADIEHFTSSSVNYYQYMGCISAFCKDSVKNK